MDSPHKISRRALVAIAGAAPLLPAAKRRIPIGLELYSVRDQMKEDLMGTVRAVAKMGYEGVEFYSPYYSWTPEYAREVRKLLDDLGIVCFSTHNGPNAFEPANYEKSIELNRIIGSKIVVMASAGRVEGIDGWKRVAGSLNAAAEKFKAAGLRAGFHNHQTEFKPLEGQKPIEVLAAATAKNVVLQLDVGTCVEAGSDPVAWINKNPGRLASIHLKEWSPSRGYKVLLGEGAAPWKQIFAAAEKAGGVESYLIEQEGSDYPPMETAQRCLDAYRKMRA